MIATPSPTPSLPAVKPREEIDRMSAAEKLDYVRQFPQDRMPAWKDPRG